MKDAFGNELFVGDFAVYAVGQGHAAGGLRIGRISKPKTAHTPILTAFNVKSHYEFDNPDEVAYNHLGIEDKDGSYLDKPHGDNWWAERKRRSQHRVIDGWQEDAPRRIGGYDQVKKIISFDEIADPELRAFMEKLNEAR